MRHDVFSEKGSRNMVQRIWCQQEGKDEFALGEGCLNNYDVIIQRSRQFSLRPASLV